MTDVPMKILTWLLLLMLSQVPATAQTPVANRVKARAARVGDARNIVAAYTDDRRHCLFFTHGNRLYRYDAIKGKSREVSFSNNSYARIVTSFRSEDGNQMFIVVDRGRYTAFRLGDGMEVWRINSFSGRVDKIASGFNFKLNKDHFVMTKAYRCLNPKAPQPKQRWTVCDHSYYLNGKPLWISDEYRWEKGKEGQP